MMMVNMFRIFTFIVVLLLASCTNNAESSQEGDYEKTKKMMVDILQTEDGKKALNEVLNDDDMKHHLVIDSDTVKDAIKEQLISEKGSEVWTNYFSDPMFVESFAQSLEKEHIDLIKRVMNDPSFQKQLIEILQDPELIKHFINLFKSENFRTHLEQLIEQSIDTPSFQGKVKKMIDQAEKKDTDSEESEGEQSDSDENSESETDAESEEEEELEDSDS